MSHLKLCRRYITKLMVLFFSFGGRLSCCLLHVLIFLEVIFFNILSSSDAYFYDGISEVMLHVKLIKKNL